jgi:predicted HAD superfamily Cof-like phosphohydrolase
MSNPYMMYETNNLKVKKFMQVFGQEVRDEPSFPDSDTIRLRIDLIREELDEFVDAIGNEDIVEVADALTDILYVTYGAGHAFGIDLEACFREVHASNMSKLEDGKPIHRADGKVMKGKNYFAPNLKRVLGFD